MEQSLQIKPTKVHLHKDARLSFPVLHEKMCIHLDEDECTKYLLNVQSYIEQYYDNESIRGEIMNEYVNYLYWNKDGFDIPECVQQAVVAAWKPRASYDVWRCDSCDGCTLVEDVKEGYIICKDCGNTKVENFCTSSKAVYTPESTVHTIYSYKRVNHFREWLSQTQGRESTDLSEAIEAVKSEIKINRICDPKNQLTPLIVRGYLKKRNMSRYYEHVNRIFADVTGMQPPQFSSELEQRFVEMFRKIQGPFQKHVPSNRKNFLSYSYVLHKMCGLLSLHSMQIYFPLLKSRDKLGAQDALWKKICTELRWNFVSSF